MGTRHPKGSSKWQKHPEGDTCWHYCFPNATQPASNPSISSGPESQELNPLVHLRPVMPPLSPRHSTSSLSVSTIAIDKTLFKVTTQNPRTSRHKSSQLCVSIVICSLSGSCCSRRRCRCKSLIWRKHPMSAKLRKLMNGCIVYCNNHKPLAVAADLKRRLRWELSP